jgi:t-SNARE complex subunit (syntaxin)
LTTDLNNVNNLKMLLETELNNNKTLLMEKEQALAVVSDTVTQAMERATQSELAQATATNELVLGKSWFTVVVVVVLVLVVVVVVALVTLVVAHIGFVCSVFASERTVDVASKQCE